MGATESALRPKHPSTTTTFSQDDTRHRQNKTSNAHAAQNVSFENGIVHGRECDIAYQKSTPNHNQNKNDDDDDGSPGGLEIVWVSGGGSDGNVWRLFQTPFFDRLGFSNITFDNRGIGKTKCRTRPETWTIQSMAQDVVDVIHATCKRLPVILVGNSLGSAVIQQVLLHNHELVSHAILMGSGAYSTGWGKFYQQAEIEFRKQGHELEGDMAVAHYAAMLYPASALGDRRLWPVLKTLLQDWVESGDAESTVIPQWQISLVYDQRRELSLLGKSPTFATRVHVISFEQDIEAPPQDGQELAFLIPNAAFHCIPNAGHCSWYGHLHKEINTRILQCILVPKNGSKQQQQQGDEKRPHLIAILACEGMYDDEERMFVACKKEVYRLLQDERAAFVYWNGHLWINGQVKPLSFRGLTQDSTVYLQRVQDVILEEICAHFRHVSEWVLLVGAHVRRPATALEHQSSFGLNTGHCHISPNLLVQNLPITTLLLDACCGNQIDMQGMDIPYVVCALDAVGYTGLVGRDFWQVFPDPFLIAKSAQESKKRRARWRVLSNPVSK